MEPFFVLLVVVLIGILVVLIRVHRRNIEKLTIKIAEVEGQRNAAHRRIKGLRRSSHSRLMDVQSKLADYKKAREQMRLDADRRVAEARETVAQEVNRRIAAETENDSLRVQNAILESQREAAIQTLGESLRPERTRCNKLPIYNREDAEYWADEKTRELGREMMFYKCDICPRYIVTGERIYHLANKDPARRTLAYHKGLPPTSSSADNTPIEVTPALLAQLRNKHSH